jgi:hypothetical protein
MSVEINGLVPASSTKIFCSVNPVRVFLLFCNADACCIGKHGVSIRCHIYGRSHGSSNWQQAIFSIFSAIHLLYQPATKCAPSEEIQLQSASGKGAVLQQGWLGYQEAPGELQFPRFFHFLCTGEPWSRLIIVSVFSDWSQQACGPCWSYTGTKGKECCFGEQVWLPEDC